MSTLLDSYDSTLNITILVETVPCSDGKK